MGFETSDLFAGAKNLLVGCCGLSAGDRLLVLQEDPALGYYDQGIADAIMSCAKVLGIRAEIQQIAFLPDGGPLDPTLIAAMQGADRTVFLSRTGDQIRFDDSLAGIRPAMSYALDAGMLASGFGRASYAGFVALKNAVNSAMAGATDIRVTCPLGTDFSGPGAAFPTTGAADVAVARFPMSIFAPVPVAGFSGVVMQGGFLVGTGSRFYTPYACPLDAPVGVHFEAGRITQFTGAPKDVTAAQAHYTHVGERFDLDPMTLHSWHAGIHPGCAYTMRAGENLERWSGGAFGNPRLMHFHTCGDFAPGEICLNVLDPTITLDGVAVWDAGVFHPARIAGGAEILAQYPDVQAVFDAPAREVGQGASGQLSAH